MIRKGKQSEIAKIITITRACATKMVSENIFQWNEHYPNETAFEIDAERGEFYVMLEGDHIVGCITISTKKDEEYEAIDWLTPDGLNYYIHRVAIHPDFQHQGRAKQLMDFAETMARSNKALSLRLDTFSENFRNQKFYEARGYRRLGNVYFPKQTDYPFYCYEFVLH